MAELSKLGRYQLRRVLGKGAMGVVYDGYDPTINRRVAIKVILKSQAIDEATARDYSARFMREAQAAGRISHPNIVQVYDFGEQDDIAYLVLEFIEGRDLRSFFSAKESFGIKESVRIMGELLDALDFAHEAKVIHRDVKPANVMLDLQRRVKLADFGVARLHDSEHTGSDTMVGTPAYMSPEQISGQKVDHRTDIFSAGSILYQLLTGEQPFKGQGAWTVAKQIMQDDPPLPSRVTVSVNPLFDKIVSKALAKNPAQRFASAREFAGALRGILDDRTQARAPASAAAPSAPKQRPKRDSKADEAEIGFWRSIQDTSDPAELELYLDEFPDGIYAKLARHKVAKLRGTELPTGVEDSGTLVRRADEERAKQEAEEQAQQEAAEYARREADEKAKREAEAEAKRDAEDAARKEAAEKARREAEQKALKEAEEKAKRQAEERARREAEDRARREAEARALAEAEARERVEREAAEKAKRDAEDAEKARREAEQKARKEAEEKAKRQAAEKAKRESEEKARQALALAKLKQQQPAGRVAAVIDASATVAIGKPPTPPSELPIIGKKSLALPAMVAVVAIAGGVAAYMTLGRAPAPPKTEVATIDRGTEERIRKETEDRIRREYADKAAADKLAADKAAAEKAALDKAAAEKAATEKLAAEKVAADKATAQKEAAAKAAADKLAADKAAAEKAALDKAAAEKAATEKLAAEKVAADKATAQKEAAAKAAADKLAADKAAAEKAAANKVALAKPTITAAAPSMQKAGAQSWNFRTYRGSIGISSISTTNNLRQQASGYFTVEDKGGKTILRLELPNLDVCFGSELNASVTRTDATTTITAVPDMRGCEPFRLVIRNDGTGGQVQTRNGSNWVSDGLDHDLTPRK